jgi:nucleosome binding factor SPN SPT16 subunit
MSSTLNGGVAILDPVSFWHRLSRLTDSDLLRRNVDGISICLNSGLKYSKSAALHLYLFGFKFPNSILVLTRRSLLFVGSKNQCRSIKNSLLSSSSMNLIVLERSVDDELQNRESFNSLITAVCYEGGNKIGCLKNIDPSYGHFIPSWQSAVENSPLEVVDISKAVGLLLSMKDETELVRAVVCYI